MAKKPFYSIDEVCAKLGRTEDQIKQMVRAGELREFRDAGKVFFKAEDIDKLAPGGEPPATDDTGDILIEPAGDLDTLDALDDKDASGSGELPTLVESSGGTSIIGLEPIDEEEAATADEDEAPPKKKKGDTVITSAGIGVFDDDELEIEADPMAKTQITTGTSEDDQISLEGAGSGSGLLDLAREADDTALGADLLDEIYPGEEEAAEEPAAAPVAAPKAAAKEPEAEVEEEEEEFVEAEAGEAVAPVVLAAGDPTEGMFAGLLVGCLILMGLAGSVMGGALQGFVPDYGRFLSSGTNFYIYLGGSIAVLLISLLAGWFLGKAFSTRRR